MLARLNVSGAWMWSAWQPDRGMNFNSYLFEREGGCVAVDPLALDPPSMEQVDALGGISTIVVTNPDHVRAAAALRERFGARIVDTFDDREEVFPGAYAVAIPHGKSDEVALHLPAAKAAVVGDAIIGAPAGALSLLPDEKLRSPSGLALALRRLWSLQTERPAPVRRSARVRRRGSRDRRIVGAAPRSRIASDKRGRDSV